MCGKYFTYQHSCIREFSSLLIHTGLRILTRYFGEFSHPYKYVSSPRVYTTSFLSLYLRLALLVDYILVLSFHGCRTLKKKKICRPNFLYVIYFVMGEYITFVGALLSQDLHRTFRHCLKRYITC